jgi:hypothetical protein
MTSLVERLRDILPLLEELETGQDCEEYAYAKGKAFQAMTYEPEAFEALRSIPEAADTIEAMQAALKTARTYMTDFEGLPHWDHDNPLRQIDAALAMIEPQPTPMSAYGANDMGCAQPIEDATYEPADGVQI